MTDAIIPNLIIYKSCRTDFGWNETVCDDYNLINNYPEQNDIVNDEVNTQMLSTKVLLRKLCTYNA